MEERLRDENGHDDGGESEDTGEEKEGSKSRRGEERGERADHENAYSATAPIPSQIHLY